MQHMGCPHYSEGGRTTRQVLKERGRGSWSDLERALVTAAGKPLAHGVLYRLVEGQRPMSLDIAIQIQDQLGVRPELWTKKIKRK